MQKNNYICPQCFKNCFAYYTLSVKIKGLWINCNFCGNFAIKYIPNLNLPYIKSSSYKKIEKIKNEKSLFDQ